MKNLNKLTYTCTLYIRNTHMHIYLQYFYKTWTKLKTNIFIPEYQRVSTNRSQTLSGGWCLGPPWFQRGCCRCGPFGPVCQHRKVWYDDASAPRWRWCLAGSPPPASYTPLSQHAARDPGPDTRTVTEDANIQSIWEEKRTEITNIDKENIKTLYCFSSQHFDVSSQR